VSYSLELEVMLAAVWAHYRQEEFEQLPGDEQSRIVAAYRTQSRAEAVVAHENARERQQAAASITSSSRL
jgi:hypothetical protein